MSGEDVVKRLGLEFGPGQGQSAFSVLWVVSQHFTFFCLCTSVVSKLKEKKHIKNKMHFFNPLSDFDSILQTTLAFWTITFEFIKFFIIVDPVCVCVCVRERENKCIHDSAASLSTLKAVERKESIHSSPFSPSISPLQNEPGEIFSCFHVRTNTTMWFLGWIWCFYVVSFSRWTSWRWHR